jgi:NADPH:quinone reductase-like Zn-dependent oxidoreductase
VKAVVFHEHGGTDVLRYEELPDPVPGPDDVVLRVEAVSVNPGPDTLTRQHGFGMPGFELPHVTGIDPAGEVVAVGSRVDAFAPGDRAVVYAIMPCGSCRFCEAGAPENYCRDFRLFGVHSWGGRAEYARVPARQLVRLPPGVSYEAAAALALSYVTAFHGLASRARIRPGETLLVVGAGGGCGVAAVQLGVALGARVFAVTGADWKAQRLAGLGAEAVFSSRDEDWPDLVREATSGHGVDVLFDNVGTETWTRSIACLDRGGRMFCSGGSSGLELSLDVRRLYREQLTFHFYTHGARADLVHLLGEVASGRIEPVIDSRFPLREAARAEEKLAARQHFGKIILTPQASGIA